MAKQAPNTITTKPISSISRPIDLIESIAKNDSEDPNPAPLYEVAIRDTIERFEATGSPFVADGEQKKYHNCYTHRVHGLPNTESLLQSTPYRNAGRSARPFFRTRQELAMVLGKG